MKRMKKKLHRSIAGLLLLVMVLTMQTVTAWAETADGQETPEASGTGMPANPVHHCTEEHDGSDTTDWSYIYFGSYPQTEVTGDALTAEITGASYDDKGDAWVDGTKYHRSQQSDSINDNTFDWSKGGDGTYHYFKWEDIKWRVLKNNGTDLFVLADGALDCKVYNEERTSVTWENCTLRKWLNETFYQTAFDDAEQAAILTQTIINDDNPSAGTEGGNDTSDSIYLLSVAEVANPEYGFCEDPYLSSASRWMQISEFAYAMGASNYDEEDIGIEEDMGSCDWWLRSPGCAEFGAAYIFGRGSAVDAGDFVNGGSRAVVPAMHIDLSSDLWSMADDGSDASGENANVSSMDDSDIMNDIQMMEMEPVDAQMMETEPVDTQMMEMEPVDPHTWRNAKEIIMIFLGGLAVLIGLSVWYINKKRNKYN